jgi:putative ABC transport system permease protein
VSIGQQKVSFGSEGKKGLVFGVSAPYVDIDSKTKIAEGAFFSDSDDRAQSSVVVLGSKLKEDLFGDQTALDRFVNIGSKKFRVVGVLEEQGGAFNFFRF